MMRIILVAVAAVALIGVLAWSVVLAVMMGFGASADGVAWPLLTGPVGDTSNSPPEANEAPVTGRV